MARRRKKLSDEEIRRKEAESGKRVSGEPDSNLSAIGAGGITGAAAGGAIGAAIGGPVGGVIGAAAGGIAGAAAADQIQDELDPKLEEVYWEENYKHRPYYEPEDRFETYLPAYRFGWESASRPDYSKRTFEEVEAQLRTDWEKQHETGWDSVRQIVYDAFERIRLRRSEKENRELAQHER